jgi:dUTPase
MSKTKEMLDEIQENVMIPIEDIPIVKYTELFEDTLSYRKHPGDACDDIKCNCDIKLEGDNIIYILHFGTEIPKGYSIRLHPRSSVRDYDLILTNCEGVIDAEYRDSYQVSFKIYTNDIFKLIKLKLLKLTNRWTINNISKVIKIYDIGERIIQAELVKNLQFKWVLVDELDMTNDRGGGHGSTGK